MTDAIGSISVVLPTFNRLAALRENFGSVLAMAGVQEIVVVVDGSTDGTREWLEQLGDPRIRVIYQQQRGSPAARNAGIDAARGEWIMMTEDDCHLPERFAVTLLEAARAADAQIVSAPWLPLWSLEEIDAAIERGRREAQPAIGLNTHPSVFPTHDLETPFLNGVVLVRRDVFDVVRYNESLRGNAWREETSMYLSAIDAGYRCVLTPRTACVQIGQWDGGQRRKRLPYEAWAIRNNWRFLRMHRCTLRRLGAIRTPLGEQLRFIISRVGVSVSGYLLARRRARADRSGATATATQLPRDAHSAAPD